MSSCKPLEHDYIGLSEVSSMLPMTSENLSSPPPTLDIKETELRLGLPGSHFLQKKTQHLSPFGLDSEDTLLGISLNLGRNPASGAKRGFLDAIDGCYARGSNGVVKSRGCAHEAVRKHIVVACDVGSELDLEKKEGHVGEHGSSAFASKAQVVGWPPIRSFRKNTTASTQAKSSDDVKGKSGAAVCLYVKVSMDGAPYLRKVDLKNYKTYTELSAALEEMFSCFNIATSIVTYEDKDGDWMLVGDVPWRMFADSCRRLRIMKGSDAIGLAPRFGEKCKKED